MLRTKPCYFLTDIYYIHLHAFRTFERAYFNGLSFHFIKVPFNRLPRLLTCIFTYCESISECKNGIHSFSNKFAKFLTVDVSRFLYNNAGPK